MSKRKPTATEQARVRAKTAIDWFIQQRATPMEVIEHKSGVVVERWLFPNGKSVWLWATPHWWDLLGPITDEAKEADTLRKAAEWVKS